ncbi:MAG TPA: hypothetical protein ENJ18_03520, partial [Nannocystis exedens]|nr:hypothetical protein [Nannocystis exedens]
VTTMALCALFCADGSMALAAAKPSKSGNSIPHATKPVPSMPKPSMPKPALPPSALPMPGMKPGTKPIDPSLLDKLPNWGFERGLSGWERSGTAFNNQPTYRDNVVASRVVNRSPVKVKVGGDYWQDLAFPIGHKGNSWIGTYERHPSNTKLGTTQGDSSKGTLTSVPFTLKDNFITFLIGGGRDFSKLKVELLRRVGGKSNKLDKSLKFSDGRYVPVAWTARTGMNSEEMRREWWDVRSLKGSTLRIRITDNSSGSWGHINVDDFRFQAKAPNKTKVPLGSRMIAQVHRHNFVPGDPASRGYVDWDAPVWGVADMHTHPASHLGFGKKLMFGAPDGNIEKELGNCNCAHGGWGVDNQCGNYLRSIIVSMVDKIYRHKGGVHDDHPHEGYPNFTYWPEFTTITHQQMWIDWIKSAHEGGLRVMVALAVNNHLLAEALDGDAPLDDKRSANAQIAYIRKLVRNNSFMEIAEDPDQLRSIVRRGKLAVILGVELDNIGNFNDARVAATPAAVRAEIRRLHGLGVRYMFPIHVTDNKFGGAAIYDDLFNLANKFASVQPLPPEVGAWVPGTAFKVERDPDPDVRFRLKPHMSNGLIVGLRALLEAVEKIPSPVPFRSVGDWLENEREYRVLKNYFLTPDAKMNSYRSVPGGHRNRKGLTSLGRVAIKEMMKLGIMIDIDHMSERSVADVLNIAEGISGKYPLNSGHNSFRRMGAVNRKAAVSENQRSDEHVRRIMDLGGIQGVGYGYEKADSSARSFLSVIGASRGWTNSKVANTCGGSSRSFAQSYLYALEKMAGSFVALGTDVNGLVSGPGPRFGPLATYEGNRCSSQSNGVRYVGGPAVGSNRPLRSLKTGNRKWDINRDGVAHYGLLPDFFQDLRNVGISSQDLSPLFMSAEYFAEMWGHSLTASRSVH